MLYNIHIYETKIQHSGKKQKKRIIERNFSKKNLAKLL